MARKQLHEGGVSMDLAYVKKLLKLVEESTVNELELEEKGIKIRITKSNAAVPLLAAQPVMSAPVITGSVPHEHSTSAMKPPPVEKKFQEVKSPIVGTFYRAPAPDADNYVEVGSSVSLGTVLCIVEAMKLMNEIECDASGKIAKVMVENGQPVEYNQVLFLIETP
jgi:acetyl-CoA carboxylase biotin carboxyl carrier protein